MASITIRRLDDEVKAALRLRAAASGRSLEAEARVILSMAARQTVKGTSESLYDVVESLFPEEGRIEGGIDCSGADRFPVIPPDFS